MSEQIQQDSTRYLKLGLFLLSGIVLLLAGIILLGARSLFERSLKAQTFLNGSVGGLQVGAPVLYRGVDIGKVSGIGFAGPRFGINPAVLGGDPAIHAVVVDLSISGSALAGISDKEFGTMVTHMVDRGLRARVTTMGLTGGTVMDLEYLDPVLNPAPVLPWRPDAIYVPSAPGGLGDTIDAVQQVAAGLKNANLPLLVAHYDKLATSARSAIDDVDGVVRANRENLQHTLADLPDTAARLRAASTRVEQILNDPRIDHLLTTLPDAGDGAKGAVADARRLLAQAGDLLSAEADDVHGTILDLRRTAANAALITDDAKQNPARLIFGNPPAHLHPGD